MCGPAAGGGVVAVVGVEVVVAALEVEDAAPVRGQVAVPDRAVVRGLVAAPDPASVAAAAAGRTSARPAAAAAESALPGHRSRPSAIVPATSPGPALRRSVGPAAA